MELFPTRKPARVRGIQIPAAPAYQARAANGGELGVRIAVWKRALATGWATVRLGRAAMTAADGAYEFTIEAALGALDPLAVQVELCAESPGAEARGAEAPGAEARGAQAPFRQEMTRTGGPDGAGRCHYRATVPAGRPSGDYTARIRPAFSGVNVPLEAAMVLWER